MNNIRSKHIKRYLQGIKNCRNITPLLPYDADRNVYWIFGVRCQKREALINFLKAKKIATGVHYFPLPLHPLFKRYDKGCEVAKTIWKTFITLPLFVELSDKEIDYIVDALIAFDRKY